MKFLRAFNQYSWAARNVVWWTQAARYQDKKANHTAACCSFIGTTIFMTFLAGPAGLAVTWLLFAMVLFVKGMVKLDRAVRAPRVLPVVRVPSGRLNAVIIPPPCQGPIPRSVNGFRVCS
jgi:hypothetical protein